MEIAINGRFLTQAITGVQRYAHEVIKAMDVLLDGNPKLKVTVVSPRLTGQPPKWRNIRLRQVGYLYDHAWEQLELPWYTKSKTLFCPANTAPVVSLLSSQPVVVTVHDLSYKYFPQAYHPAFRLWYSFLIPLILRRARSVITVSESERGAIISHYPRAAACLHAIANGGLPTGLCVEERVTTARSDGYILYVGSFSQRKNFSGLLEAACRLARKRSFNFIFVGGTSKSLAATSFTIPSDIGSRFTFIDAVNDPADLVPYYQNATCFLFPSFYESSGLPPVEAMACGCPVIVSDIPALKERCGDAAVYCDPYDIDSVCAAVETVMDDERLRAKLQLLGRIRAEAFSWSHSAAQTLQLLRNQT
jgi:glycosyltransferase involved in cell wall biosynthesis